MNRDNEAWLDGEREVFRFQFEWFHLHDLEFISPYLWSVEGNLVDGRSFINWLCSEKPIVSRWNQLPPICDRIASDWSALWIYAWLRWNAIERKTRTFCVSPLSKWFARKTHISSEFISVPGTNLWILNVSEFTVAALEAGINKPAAVNRGRETGKNTYKTRGS